MHLFCAENPVSCFFIFVIVICSFLAVLCGMWYHSSPTRNQTLALEAQRLNGYFPFFFQHTVLDTFYGRMSRGYIVEGGEEFKLRCSMAEQCQLEISQ